MDVARKLLVALIVALFSFGAVACDAEGSIGEGGLEGEVEGEGGEGEGEGD